MGVSRGLNMKVSESSSAYMILAQVRNINMETTKQHRKRKLRTFVKESFQNPSARIVRVTKEYEVKEWVCRVG
jgi:hypothetical protein